MRDIRRPECAQDMENLIALKDGRTPRQVMQDKFKFDPAAFKMQSEELAVIRVREQLAELVERTPFALSIKQPWADLILFDGKDIENRTWPLPEKMKGQRVLVHAGQKSDGEFTYPRCRCGVIVGEVTIVECVTDSSSSWFSGPYGFVLADPKPFGQPVPCRGRLGFFKPTPSPKGMPCDG